MAKGNHQPTTGREQAAGLKAIGYGLAIMRVVGRERFEYMLQTINGLELEQIEALLDQIERGEVQS